MKCGSSVSNYNYCEWFYITQLWLCWTALLYSYRYLSILNSPPFKKDLFMYFRLFVAMHGLSVVVARGALLSIVVHGLLVAVASLAVERRL